MTTYLLKAGFVVLALAGIASEALAQGRPGGSSGGMRPQGGGRCGGGMNSSVQGSRNMGSNPAPQQSAMNSIRAYQQQVAMMAYQTQLQAAFFQQAQQQRASQSNSGSVMVSLSTAPRQGASAASDRSPAWSSEYTVEPPVRTVTPGKTPVVLAVNPPMHVAYSIASSASLEKKIQEYITSGDVVLLDSPLNVFVETTVKGLAYVRPTEGRYKGKFFVVEERFVK